MLVWDELKEDMADGTVFDVRSQRQSLPALLVMSVESVHLSRLHSLPSPMWEDTEKLCRNDCAGRDHHGKKDIQKLVLSAKMIQKERALAEKTQHIGRLTTGDLVEGPVTRMESMVYLSILEKD